MVKMRMENDGDVHVAEGKFIVSVIIDPTAEPHPGSEMEDPRSALIVMGSGKREDLVMRLADAMYNFTQHMGKDSIEKMLLGLLMLEQFKGNLKGENEHSVEVLKDETRPETPPIMNEGRAPWDA